MLQTIKVYPETKAEIDKFKKKGMSYDDVLTSFVTYFTVTKINPNQFDSSPISITQKATERVVKIIKNIEHKKLSKMLFMLDEIHHKLVVKKEDTPLENEGSFTDEEIASLVEKIENGEKTEVKLTQKINELNKKIQDISNEKQATSSIDVSILDEIISCAQELKDTKKSGLGANGFVIKKNVFSRNIDTIINLCKNR